jgi:hypothetical protein
MLTETITVGGRVGDVVVLCRERDLRRELWYDEAGNWLQSRLEDDHLTRTSVPARAGL